MWKLENILDFMKKHPIKSYVYAGHQCLDIWEEIGNFKCLKEYVFDWISYHKYEYKKNRKNKKLYKVGLKFAKKLNEHYVIFIQRPSNWSPMFRLVLRRKNPCNDERAKYEEECIEEFEDKYFMEFSVDQYDYAIKELTEKELEDDKKLFEQFRGILQHYLDNADKDTDSWGKLIYSNCKYILLDVDDIGVT